MLYDFLFIYLKKKSVCIYIFVTSYLVLHCLYFLQTKSENCPI